MKLIPLTQKKVALVDDVDFEELNQFKWYAYKDKCTFYARRNISVDGHQLTVLMHQAILDIPKGMMADHIDGDGLNNTRENLRVVTPRGNNQNLHIERSSRYPGVSRSGRVKLPWYACIKINRKTQNLGRYATEEEAFTAYKKAVDEIEV